MGDTPEEILARLQAKNVVSAGSTSAPAPQPAKPAAPASPALPTGIGTPILPKAGSPAPAPAANPTSAPAPTPVPAPTATPAPARTEAPNPLLKLLNSNPVELLNKFVDRDTPDLDKLLAEVKKSDEQVLTKSATSFNGLNLAVELQRLSVPVLLLHGKDDPILPAPSDEMLMRINKSKPAGHLLAFVEPELHHFPMLEITAKFDRLLMDFFDAQDLSNVQFKDQWRRTMR